ncbi:unnamed protein product [Staurois parvus]|uniref:Uncharacterized protein n=1 Tax=Staurois parvus TaxID=386267 RepID=A0ABN9BP67_9NEOB|nr:unnamed protein product [Staurois parvus]
MNPSCARCGKIVYPTEKVNCLDKVISRLPHLPTHPVCLGIQVTYGPSAHCIPHSVGPPRTV